MKIYVYPTDRQWFDFLRQRTILDEINFWQPGGGRAFSQLQPGELFLFRLKSPVDRIAGGGFYLHSSVLPLGLAWDAFEEKNGTPDFATFRRLIASYKKVSPPEQLPLDSMIGCIVLQYPVFLPPDKWIPVPSDYHPNLVQGKGYDAASGTGRDLYEWANAMLQAAAPIAVAERAPSPMWGDLTLVRRRLGQGGFRVLVTDLYSRRCAVTGEKTLPVLQAAHIRPVSRGGEHRPDNGLLLRSDIHTLFDLGYVGVTPDYRFVVSPRLRSEWQNGRVYYDLGGREISRPANPEHYPARERLEWHMDTIFRR